MKNFLAIALTLSLVFAISGPVLAGTGESSGDEEIKNLKVGITNATSGATEFMDQTAMEAAKGRTTGEQLTGVLAGGVVGVRKGIHRVGAGAIDILTFWIPKKQPLITPEEPRLK